MNQNIERIIGCLQKAGLQSLPTNPQESLAEYGFDSLVQALTILEIEKEFKIRIPFSEDTAKNLTSISSLNQLILRINTKL